MSIRGRDLRRGVGIWCVLDITAHIVPRTVRIIVAHLYLVVQHRRRCAKEYPKESLV